jgi:hypothetical protein
MAVERNAVKGEASSVVWVVGDGVSCGGIGAGVTAKRDVSIINTLFGWQGG